MSSSDDKRASTSSSTTAPERPGARGSSTPRGESRADTDLERADVELERADVDRRADTNLERTSSRHDARQDSPRRRTSADNARHDVQRRASHEAHQDDRYIVRTADAPPPPAVDARAALGKTIPRRPRVSWWIGLLLAFAFAILVVPWMTADRTLLSLGVGPVALGEQASVTVRVPPFAGHDTHDGHLTGGGVVIARGGHATRDQAYAVQSLAETTPRGVLPYVAYFLLALVCAALCSHHLQRSTKGRLVRVQIVSFLLIAILAAVVELVMLTTSLSVLVVPVAVFALVPTMVLDRVVGLATGVLAALVVSLLVPFDVHVTILLLVQVATAGLVVPERPKRRWRSALVAGLASTVFTVATYVLLAYLTTNALPPVRDGLNSLYLAVLAGPLIATFVAVPLLPFYQLLVGEITHGKLVELEDLSHPLLRQIAEKAPGSWQHSLMMANMAEIAANAIGANGRLVRVGAYYHDLGKSLAPKYFIENLEPGETSPHDGLPPEVSCDAIFAHVTEGITCARRAGLHERIVDFMHMHHGNGVLEYFWGKAREQGNPRNLSVEQFRYPGHPPQSRETAILAICDAVEAASRTLKKPDPASIDSLVQRIVYGKLHLGQLDESGLSMSDLRRISDSLRETIRHANHGRIEYPWQKAQQDASATKADPLTQTGPRLDSLDRPGYRDANRPSRAGEPAESTGPTGPTTPRRRTAAGSAEALATTADLRDRERVSAEELGILETAPSGPVTGRNKAMPASAADDHVHDHGDSAHGDSAHDDRARDDRANDDRAHDDGAHDDDDDDDDHLETNDEEAEHAETLFKRTSNVMGSAASDVVRSTPIMDADGRIATDEAGDGDARGADARRVRGARRGARDVVEIDAETGVRRDVDVDETGVRRASADDAPPAELEYGDTMLRQADDLDEDDLGGPTNDLMPRPRPQPFAQPRDKTAPDDEPVQTETILQFVSRDTKRTVNPVGPTVPGTESAPPVRNTPAASTPLPLAPTVPGTETAPSIRNTPRPSSIPQTTLPGAPPASVARKRAATLPPTPVRRAPSVPPPTLGKPSPISPADLDNAITNPPPLRREPSKPPITRLPALIVETEAALSSSLASPRYGDADEDRVTDRRRAVVVDEPALARVSGAHREAVDVDAPTPADPRAQRGTSDRVEPKPAWLQNLASRVDAMLADDDDDDGDRSDRSDRDGTDRDHRADHDGDDVDGPVTLERPRELRRPTSKNEDRAATDPSHTEEQLATTARELRGPATLEHAAVSDGADVADASDGAGDADAADVADPLRGPATLEQPAMSDAFEEHAPRTTLERPAVRTPATREHPVVAPTYGAAAPHGATTREQPAMPNLLEQARDPATLERPVMPSLLEQTRGPVVIEPRNRQARRGPTTLERPAVRPPASTRERLAEPDREESPFSEHGDEWAMETPVVPVPAAALRSLLGQPDPTREQSLDEIEALHLATRSAQSSPDILLTPPSSRTPRNPTTEVDPDEIEAAIEIAPPARTRAPSSIGVAKPKKP